jgi:hypothetical protein
MFSNLLLAAWTFAGLAWWTLAWGLARRAAKISQPGVGATAPPRSLSIFKPLPPLGNTGLAIVAAGLESFVAQLDLHSELLLGIHEADRDLTAPFLKRLRAEHPGARIQVIFRSDADGMANPKIAWQKILSHEASGELWLWSDADIVAPPGFLASARVEYARSGAALLTFPYVVRKIPCVPALLEALFVNAEFHPGVLLLRALGPVDFGLGAAMLFQRDDFLRDVDWNEIGSWLADDFFLGQKLQPVRIGSAQLATVPTSATWNEALMHDLRWTKTIRWNRPMGAFSRIVILPVLGWLIAVVIAPASALHWLGLAGIIQVDVLFAAAICRQAGCPLRLEHFLLMEFWSFWRVILWFSCWLPWPVSWREKMWPT